MFTAFSLPYPWFVQRLRSYGFGVNMNRPTRICSLGVLVAFTLSLPAAGQLFSPALIPEPAIALIRRPGIQEELTLSAGQVEELNRIRDTEFNSFHHELKTLKHEFLQRSIGASRDEQEKNFKHLVEFANEGNRRLRQLVLEVLSVHQRKRFDQILFQYHVSRGHYEIALSLSGIPVDVDSNRLKEMEKSRRAVVDAQIAQLELETRTAMLGRLWSVSRNRLRRLAGDVFDFKAGETIGPLKSQEDEPNPRR